MDGGAFYGRTNISDNSSVGPSRHFTSPPSASWLPHMDGGMSYAPNAATAADAAFGQKLDRVLILLENQRKEIDCIKEDTAVLKSDVEVLKQRISESSASSGDSPPSGKKLPTELSVS